MKRTMDPSLLNRVSNSPEVRPWLGGKGELDYGPAVSDPANVALCNEFGGFIAVKRDAGLYEVHSQFLPEGRGAGLVEDARKCLRYMFVQTDCVELQTQVPANNRGALALTLAGGFRKLFERERAWEVPEGEPCSVQYFSLSFEEWKAKDKLCFEKGKEFHEWLSKNVKPPEHPDDLAHDIAVGAAVLMALAGNARKALWLYNRWALFTGYAPLALLSEHPVVLDIRDAVISIGPSGLEVLLCRSR